MTDEERAVLALARVYHRKVSTRPDVSPVALERARQFHARHGLEATEDELRLNRNEEKIVPATKTTYYIKTKSGHYLRDWSKEDPTWSDTRDQAFGFYSLDGAKSKLVALRDIGVKGDVVKA